MSNLKAFRPVVADGVCADAGATPPRSIIGPYARNTAQAETRSFRMLNKRLP